MDQRQRRPAFTAETLRLFAELEALPPRHLERSPHKEKSKRLAVLLDLGTEWFSSITVHTRHGPPQQTWLASYRSWFRVRAVREALLAATGSGSRGRA